MFVVKKQDAGLSAPFEYLTATVDENIAMGEALVLSSGKLTKCGATAKPAYIALGPQDDNDLTPVVKVQAYLEFETILQAAGTGLHIGDAVTLHTDGLQVTATTASGVATITGMNGTGVGDHVCVRFL